MVGKRNPELKARLDAVAAKTVDAAVLLQKLGLKPESLSRVFAKLRLVGVDVRASNVVVRDMAQLCKLVACDRITARCPVKPRMACPEPAAARVALPEMKSVTA